MMRFLSPFLLLLLAPAGAGQDVLAVSASGDAWSVDSVSGISIFLAPTGFSNLNGMARNNQGELYSVSYSSLITIDEDTGVGAFAAALSLNDVRGLCFDDQDQLWAIQDGGPLQPDLLFQIDPSTGTTTFIGDTGFVGLQALAFTEGVFYSWDIGFGSGIGAGLVTLDPLTGLASDVDPNVDGTAWDVQTLFEDENGQLWGGRYQLFHVDVSSGQLTLASGLGFDDFRGLEFTGPKVCLFELTTPIPGLAGLPNSVFFQCSTPSAEVHLFVSTATGLTDVGGACPGLQLELAAAKDLGSVTADALGGGFFSGMVPSSLSGRVLYLQALDLTACQLSNRVAYLFP
ncbi:MAG: hypothetical protein DWQ01_16945 [Planctomycetota bacterium]|nr:MAG: hypothetical protein DWQ01_16945 [Planctomycetota bacterium]